MPAPLQFRVSLARQSVEAVRGGAVVWSAPVSTSKFGAGTENGSFKTPTGKFRIAEKIGDGEPEGMIFKGRRPTGDIWSPDEPDDREEEDLILTRILWLEGTEPHNANTKGRYIYFHGTNHEEAVGTPASHGCIRLRTGDLLRLFALAEEGTEVEIRED
jgi:lipoprotein-anchoring transpeptidase ErfK/SrfK